MADRSCVLKAGSLFVTNNGQNIAFPYHEIWVVWAYENYR